MAVAFVTGAMRPAAAVPTVPGQADEPIDCVGPAEQVEPGSPEWDALNVANAYCARERHLDKPAHTVLEAAAPADAYREPTRHAGVRFRYDTTTIGGLDAEVYRPRGLHDLEGVAGEWALYSASPPDVSSRPADRS